MKFLNISSIILKNPNVATMSHGHANMGENIRMLDQRLSEIEETYAYGIDDFRQNISDVLEFVNELERKQLGVEHDLAIIRNEDLDQTTKIFAIKSDVRLARV